MCTRVKKLVKIQIICVFCFYALAGCVSNISGGGESNSIITTDNQMTTSVKEEITTNQAVSSNKEETSNKEDASYKDDISNEEKTTDKEDSTNEEEITSKDDTNSKKEVSFKKLLRVVKQPLGSTMYIWGGGWNEEDTAAGPSATMIGVNPQWATFASEQNKDYDYKNHRYEINNGLDCSGYVGWVMYNMLENKNGKQGYVYKATTMTKEFSNLGLGIFIENSTEFLPGDIVSMKGHVWISLGTCEDGSVLLIHSSPPGVTISGTLLANGEESIASRLANEYMQKEYPDWYEKYQDSSVTSKYITDVTVFRWDDKIMSDIKEYQNIKGEDIIKMMFE